jgi:hypothetical protein
MKLKRQFANGPDKPCTHMTVVHTGTHPEQNFSQRMVAHGLVEGWMRLDGGALYLKADGGEELRYVIRRSPGYYCKSSGEPIAVSAAAVAQLFAGHGKLAAAEAQAWLAAHGKAPGDYEATWAYECVLDDAQHARYRAVRDVAGNPVAAHTQEA